MSLCSLLFSVILSLLTILLTYLLYDFRRRLTTFQRKKIAYNSSSSSSSFRRLMCGIEAFFEHRQHQNDWINVNAVFIESRVDEPIEEKLLSKALSRLAAKQPMLRMKVGTTKSSLCRSEGDGGGGEEFLTFQEDPEFAVDLETISTNDWIAVCEAEMCKGFGTKGPLWRAKILQTPDGRIDRTLLQRQDSSDALINVLVFSFHHGIIDGTSIMRFHDQLIDELCQCSRSESMKETLPEVESLSLPPASVDALPPRLFYMNPVVKFITFSLIRIYICFASTLPSMHKKPCGFLRILGRDLLPRPAFATTKMIPIEISTEFTQTFLRVCKKNGLKVHASLSTVAMEALKRTIQRLLWNESGNGEGGRGGEAGGGVGEGIQTTTLGFDYPISLKPFTTRPPLSPLSLSCCIGGAHIHHETIIRSDGTDGDEKRERTQEWEREHNQVPKSAARQSLYARFWEDAQKMAKKVAENLEKERLIIEDFWIFEHLYRWFPAVVANTMAKFDVTKYYEFFDFQMSNRGACSYLVKEDGEKRPFELIGTNNGCGVQLADACFYHYVVSVRGKFCWTLAYREGLVTRNDALIYKECIENVLKEAVSE